MSLFQVKINIYLFNTLLFYLICKINRYHFWIRHTLPILLHWNNRIFVITISLGKLMPHFILWKAEKTTRILVYRLIHFRTTNMTNKFLLFWVWCLLFFFKKSAFKYVLLSLWIWVLISFICNMLMLDVAFEMWVLLSLSNYSSRGMLCFIKFA